MMGRTPSITNFGALLCVLQLTAGLRNLQQAAPTPDPDASPAEGPAITTAGIAPTPSPLASPSAPLQKASPTCPFIVQDADYSGGDIKNSPAATIDDCCKMCTDSLSQWTQKTYKDSELGYYFPVRGTCFYWTFHGPTNKCFQKNPYNYNLLEDAIRLAFKNNPTQSDLDAFVAKHLNTTDSAYHLFADDAFQLKEAPGFFGGTLFGLITIQHSIGDAFGGFEQMDFIANFDGNATKYFDFVDVLNGDKCDKPHCQNILAKIKPSALTPLPPPPPPPGLLSAYSSYLTPPSPFSIG